MEHRLPQSEDEIAQEWMEVLGGTAMVWNDVPRYAQAVLKRHLADFSRQVCTCRTLSCTTRAASGLPHCSCVHV